jgi:hypothetical protein
MAVLPVLCRYLVSSLSGAVTLDVKKLHRVTLTLYSKKGLILLCPYIQFKIIWRVIWVENECFHGNGNDGTINGATYVSGISGQALSFDGVEAC